jgi:hypothetical protein
MTAILLFGQASVGPVPIKASPTGTLDVQSLSGYRARTIVFSRPNDVIAYTAGDAIAPPATASLLEVQNVVDEGQVGGCVMQVYGATDQRGCVARLRLWFWDFNDTGWLCADNTVGGNKGAGDGISLGYIDLPAMQSSAAAGGSWALKKSDLSFLINADGTHNNKSLWMQVETLDAFTPAVNQVFQFVLTIKQG